MKHDRHLLAAFREALLTQLQFESLPDLPSWPGLQPWAAADTTQLEQWQPAGAWKN